MRAFMSDSNARVKAIVASLDFSPSGELASYDAEREARAILAETTADSFGPISGLRECIGSEWADAARESLAAFIEQEF